MIEYLEQLVEEKKYEEAALEAERLVSLTQDSQELLIAHSALVTCRFRLGDFGGTFSSGEAARDLATRLGSWDHFGSTTLYLGAAYSRLGRYAEAVNLMYDYLGKLGFYKTAVEFESTAWYNLGIWLTSGLGQPEEGAKALYKALDAAVRHGKARDAHGIRQALVDVHLKAGRYEPIPRLLVQCGHYLRNHPDLYMGQKSRIFHSKLRAEFAAATGRLWRAKAVALRGLELATGQPEHECRFHLLLARVARLGNAMSEGMGHALAAKACAAFCGRPDLEKEAAQTVHELSLLNPGDNGIIKNRWWIEGV